MKNKFQPGDMVKGISTSGWLTMGLIVRVETKDPWKGFEKTFGVYIFALTEGTPPDGLVGVVISRPVEWLEKLS
jgi:hypothetical protein